MDKRIRLWTIEEAVEYLHVSRRTIFNLIKRYELPAVKIGKSLSFRLKDLEIFITKRLTIQGLYGTKPIIFKKQVLDKYFKSPDIYYVHDEGFSGKVGNRRALINRSIPLTAKTKLGRRIIRESFAEVFYNKVKVKGNKEVILISAREMEKIPSEERLHWNRFILKSISG